MGNDEALADALKNLKWMTRRAETAEANCTRWLRSVNALSRKVERLEQRLTKGAPKRAPRPISALGLRGKCARLLFEAGYKQADISALVGLTRQRVSQIKDAGERDRLELLRELNCGAGEKEPCRADLSKGQFACARHAFESATQREQAALRLAERRYKTLQAIEMAGSYPDCNAFDLHLMAYGETHKSEPA